MAGCISGTARIDLAGTEGASASVAVTTAISSALRTGTTTRQPGTTRSASDSGTK